MNAIRPPEAEGFVVLLRDKPFVMQARRRIAPDREQFHWTTHAELVGAAKPIREAAELALDPQGKVTSYTLYARGSTLHHADFSAERAAVLTLRDGSTHELSLGGRPDLVLQQNLLLQLSLSCARLDREAGERKLHFFSPEALAVRELVVAPTGTSDWETSIGIRLVMDGDGRLLRAEKIADGSPVVGKTVQPEFHDVPLETLRGVEAAMPTPEAPAGVTRDEVEIDGDDVTLHGLFVHTDAPTVFKATCLFLNGSGSITRWGEATDTRLKTLETMDALATRGVASLSIDARGAGATGFGRAGRLLSATRLADADAAWQWLAAKDDTGKAPFVVGHSLGALVILLLLHREPERQPRGIILLAPPGRPLRAVLMEQSAREARRMNLSDEEARKREAALVQWLDRESRGEGDALRLGGLRPLTDPVILDTEPRDLVQAVRCPLLILHGDKDIQTSAEKDAAALYQTAREQGVAVEYRELADADHLFRLEPEASTVEHYTKDLVPNPDYLAIMLDWIDGHAN